MPTGRPHILDEAKLGEICVLVGAGLPLREAARYVGCSVRTIRRQQQCDESFGRELAKAELDARMEPETLIRGAAATNWRAAAWLLDRTRRRGPQRSAITPARLLDALQTLSASLIESALAQCESPDEQARERLYANLAEVAQACINDIVTRGAPAVRQDMCTPRSDLVRFDREASRRTLPAA